MSHAVHFAPPLHTRYLVCWKHPKTPSHHRVLASPHTIVCLHACLHVSCTSACVRLHLCLRNCYSNRMVCVCVDATTGAGHPGDNDPVDAIEIGTRQWPMGAVVRVKLLGALAMIDNGEADWKLIVINCADPLAAKASPQPHPPYPCFKVLPA